MHIKSSTMISSQEEEEISSPTTTKLLESGHLGQDSGFLSGACTTESDLSSTSACDLGLGASCSSSLTTSAGFSRLDSGVDVCDPMSQLNLTSSQHDDNNKLPKLLEYPQHSTKKSINPSEYPPWEDFFTPDEDGDSQLHIAIMEGYVDAVYILISLVPSPHVLDIQNDYCQTPLHLAVLSKQPRIARRLVAAGARVDLRDRSGNTALHLACASGDMGSVQALTMALNVQEIQECQLRYSPFAQTLPQQLNLCNYDGQAPIHLAAMGGNCDVIRALHWLGANLNSTDNKGGRTALHMAIERGHLQAIRTLCEECGCDVELESYGGLTPYQSAESQKNPKFSSILLSYGASQIPLVNEEIDDNMGESEDSDSDSDLT